MSSKKFDFFPAILNLPYNIRICSMMVLIPTFDNLYHPLAQSAGHWQQCQYLTDGVWGPLVISWAGGLQVKWTVNYIHGGDWLSYYIHWQGSRSSPPSRADPRPASGATKYQLNMAPLRCEIQSVSYFVSVRSKNQECLHFKLIRGNQKKFFEACSNLSIGASWGGLFGMTGFVAWFQNSLVLKEIWPKFYTIKYLSQEHLR